jgi:hypothetical protein
MTLERTVGPALSRAVVQRREVALAERHRPVLAGTLNCPCIMFRDHFQQRRPQHQASGITRTTLPSVRRWCSVQDQFSNDSQEVPPWYRCSAALEGTSLERARIQSQVEDFQQVMHKPPKRSSGGPAKQLAMGSNPQQRGAIGILHSLHRVLLLSDIECLMTIGDIGSARPADTAWRLAWRSEGERVRFTTRWTAISEKRAMNRAMNEAGQRPVPRNVRNCLYRDASRTECVPDPVAGAARTPR